MNSSVRPTRAAHATQRVRAAARRHGPHEAGPRGVAQAWRAFLQKGPHAFLYSTRDPEHYLYESRNL